MSYLLIGAAPLAGLPGEPVAILDGTDRPRFDNATDTWSATLPDGRVVTAALVVDARAGDDPAIAVHALPNWFRIPGPDTAAQTRVVARCLNLVERSGIGRIEARSRVRARRWYPGGLARRFYLTGTETVEDEVYDGPATLTLTDREISTRIRLTGHLHPVDGRFHWQGSVFDTTAIDRAGPVRLTIGETTVDAKLTERTAQGMFMIVGSGPPPYPLVRGGSSAIPV